jgi:hypothetical protein
MPALLLVVEPVEPVVALDAPPSRPEAEVAEPALVLVPNELEVNAPSTVLACVAPWTVEFDVALATCAFADAPIREQATAAEAAIRDIFMVNTSLIREVGDVRRWKGCNANPASSIRVLQRLLDASTAWSEMWTQRARRN